MQTYNTNPKIKEEALIIAKKDIAKKNRLFSMASIGCLAFTIFIFLMNLVRVFDIGIGMYLLASFGMSLAPIIIGTITFVHLKKEMRRTYFESEKEKITLYNDYMEYSYRIGDIETTYRIPYKNIHSLFIIEGYELVIMPRNIRVIHNNKRTLTKKTDNGNQLRRIEILYCFDNGDEMMDRIREAVYPDKEENEDEE